MNIPEIELSSVQISKDNVTITISKNLAKYLGINRNVKEIYAIPTNSVLQLSVKEPIATIPLLTEDNMEFEAQNE